MTKMKDVRLVKEQAILQQMIAWDEREVCKNFKFGVLYCKEGQTTEADIFANTSGSPFFEKLLDCLGERIQLRGWNKYPFL